jgi:hypothetical protein
MTSIQQNENQNSESSHMTQAFIVGFWGVRYQVKDVQRATGAGKISRGKSGPVLDIRASYTSHLVRAG